MNHITSLQLPQRAGPMSRLMSVTFSLKDIGEYSMLSRIRHLSRESAVQARWYGVWYRQTREQSENQLKRDVTLQYRIKNCNNTVSESPLNADTVPERREEYEKSLVQFILPIYLATTEDLTMYSVETWAGKKAKWMLIGTDGSRVETKADRQHLHTWIDIQLEL